MNKSTMLRTCVYTCFLLFLIVAPACEKDPGSSPSSSQNDNSTVFDSLTGTRWVLYQYRDTLSAVAMPRNDTLIFFSNSMYTYNGIPQRYSLYTASNVYYKYVFTLENTPFGTLTGNAPLTFKTYGEIIDEPFYQLNGQVFRIWLKKVN